MSTTANDFECPSFVGALLADEAVIGSAFFCHLPRLIVTCAHTIGPGIKELSWRQFNGDVIKLGRWRMLVRDTDVDLAVIAIPLPMPVGCEFADLPRPATRRGIDVFFSAVGQFLGTSGLEYPFDSGSGRLVGEHRPINGTRRIKMQSSHVTPGCSGAPVLHYSAIGITVVGMISGRYNSPNWNRDTVWLVPAEDLRFALQVAQGLLLAEDLAGDPLAIISSDFATTKFLEFIRNTAEDPGSPRDAPENSFLSQSDSRSYVSNLREIQSESER